MLNYVKQNSLQSGIVVGGMAPVVIFVAATLLMSRHITWVGYLSSMFYMGTLSKILSLCVYPNLGLFYLYLHFDREVSARGVVLSTLFMALVVLLLFLAQKMV